MPQEAIKAIPERALRGGLSLGGSGVIPLQAFFFISKAVLHIKPQQLMRRDANILLSNSLSTVTQRHS